MTSRDHTRRVPQPLPEGQTKEAGSQEDTTGQEGDSQETLQEASRVRTQGHSQTWTMAEQARVCPRTQGRSNGARCLPSQGRAHKATTCKNQDTTQESTKATTTGTGTSGAREATTTSPTKWDCMPMGLMPKTCRAKGHKKKRKKRRKKPQ